MRRREVIAGALLAALAAVEGIAQHAERVRLVGMLMGIPSEDAGAKYRAAALEGTLAALGWSRERNLQIEYRWADGGPDHLRAAAQELVALGCEVNRCSLDGGRFGGRARDALDSDRGRRHVRSRCERACEKPRAP